MSILKIEITENHLKLLKHLQWSVDKKGFIIGCDDEFDVAPFGENNLYDACNIILLGRPENFDPLNTDELTVYSQEQRDEWDKLYSELPMCLSIILQRQSFETGLFKAKYHDQRWEKIKK